MCPTDAQKPLASRCGLLMGLGVGSDFVPTSDSSFSVPADAVDAFVPALTTPARYRPDIETRDE